MSSWEYLRWKKRKATGMCSVFMANLILTYPRGFKGLKQAIKVEFKLGRYTDVSPLKSHLAVAADFLGCRTLSRIAYLR